VLWVEQSQQAWQVLLLRVRVLEQHGYRKPDPVKRRDLGNTLTENLSARH
jgi:hypothetical protein